MFFSKKITIKNIIYIYIENVDFYYIMKHIYFIQILANGIRQTYSAKIEYI